jgi:hypothetical protein
MKKSMRTRIVEKNPQPHHNRGEEEKDSDFPTQTINL